MPFKVAIIGCGGKRDDKQGWSIGHSHADAYKLALPDVELYGVDIVPENLAAFGEKFALPASRLFPSTKDLFAALTPDIVSICTWPALHCPQTVEAAQAGVRAILCEKPMALDPLQIDKMISVCTKSKTHLAIAHQRSYDSIFVQAKKIIDSGALGENLNLEARVGGGWDILSWSVHWFDMAAHLFNSPITSVLAGVDYTRQRRYNHAIENSSVLFTEHAAGQQSTFITGPNAPLGYGLFIRGTLGELRIAGSLLALSTTSGYQKFPIENPDLQGYAGLIADIAKVLAGTATSTLCDASVSANATRVAYAAHESARTHRRIELADYSSKFAPLEVLEHTPTPTKLVKHAVLFADNHHADPVSNEGGREGLRDALLAFVAETVTVVPAESREITPADLATADLLVLYHTQTQSTPSVRQTLSDYITAGKPTVIAHCGIGAYADWREFHQWLGRYWVWRDTPGLEPSGHPHVPCTLRLTENSTLNLTWSETWLPTDEVYVKLGTASPIEVLATMHADNIDDPAIWRSSIHKNLIVTLPGHRRDIWTLPAMHAQLRATCAEVLPKK